MTTTRPILIRERERERGDYPLLVTLPQWVVEGNQKKDQRKSKENHMKSKENQRKSKEVKGKSKENQRKSKKSNEINENQRKSNKIKGKS